MDSRTVFVCHISVPPLLNFQPIIDKESVMLMFDTVRAGERELCDHHALHST